MLSEVVVLSLVVWRVSSLLYDEEGPWGSARWLRERLGIQHDEDGDPVAYPAILQPLQCFWCLTLLVGIPILVYNRPLVGKILTWIAASAGAIIVERWRNWRK